MAKGNTNTIVWFLAGSALGAACALLFSPGAGNENRRLISRKAEGGREALGGSGRELFDRGRELYDKGRQIADEAAEVFERGRQLVQG